MLHRMTPPRTPGVSADTVATDLTLAVGQLIRRLRSEIDSEGLGMSQTSALARLERQGPMTTADLARAEAMKPQSMKAILASLEEDGLVERQPHPTDGRQILFLLTAAGREARRKRARGDVEAGRGVRQLGAGGVVGVSRGVAPVSAPRR